MILVVGLSPAWQRTLVFAKMIPGRVNRARHVSEAVSGKAVNVARVATILGAEVRLLTVAGGARGRLLQSELKREGLRAHVVPVTAETRICQTLLDGGSATELVEEAGPLSRREVEEVMRVFATEVRRARLVVLTGTVPDGCGSGFYARLVDECRVRAVRGLIDAQGGQLRNALRRRPFLVRINRQELAAATPVDCRGRAGVRRAVGALMRGGPQWAVISDGANAVYVGENPDRRLRVLTPPQVTAKNPIGSGDAMMAGLAVGLWRGQSVLDAVQLGVACGAANALTPDPGFLRVSDVRRLCSTHNRRVPIV
ncbi:MAG TPA: PfkB family carbohydrate kinase [Verrucomicrobiae bacterium]|nr:PfkB family carbohydrate kinase [Verrucomicrobiae bacterium]